MCVCMRCAWGSEFSVRMTRAECCYNPESTRIATLSRQERWLLTIISFAATAQLMPRADAMLTAGDPVKNARALLRYALPVENKSVRTIQVISPPLHSMHQCRWESPQA